MSAIAGQQIVSAGLPVVGTSAVGAGTSLVLMVFLKNALIVLGSLVLVACVVFLLWQGLSSSLTTPVNRPIKIGDQTIEEASSVFEQNFVQAQSTLVGGDCYPPIGHLIDTLPKLFALFEKAYGVYAPSTNRARYYEYACSQQFQEDAQRAHVYAKGSDITSEVAYVLTSKRDLTNVRGTPLGNLAEAKALLGESATSYYHTVEGPLQWILLGVFTPTVAWIGGRQEQQVEVFSISAPPLDDTSQPLFGCFVQNNRLDVPKYEKAMEDLAEMIFKAFQDCSKYKTIILPRVGQGVFLSALTGEDRALAEQAFFTAFRKALLNFLNQECANNVRVLFSQYSAGGGKIVQEAPLMQELQAYGFSEEEQQKISLLNWGILQGDIKHCDLQGAFVVNAWNPAARVGNGNERSGAFDGALGSVCPASLVATPAHNVYLQRKTAYTILSDSKPS